MSATEGLVAANQRYAKKFRNGRKPMPPAKNVAVVACMDARVKSVDQLGGAIGRAIEIRPGCRQSAAHAYDGT